MSATELNERVHRIVRGRTARLGAVAMGAVTLGVAQQAYVMIHLGAGRETDAFFAALAVPTFVLAVLGTAVANVIVPILAGENTGHARQDSWAFIWWVTAVFGALGGILALLAPVWVPLLVPGLDGSAQELAVNLARIQMVAMVFNAQGTIAACCCQAVGRFRRPALAPLAGGMVGLAFVLVLVPVFGIHGAAWAEVARLGITFAVVVPGLGRPVAPSWRSPAVGDALRRMRPLVLGGLYYRSDVLVDRVLGSLTPAGGLSILALGTRLYGVGAQVVTNAVTVPALTELAVHHKRGRPDMFDERWRRALRATVVLSCAAWLAVCAVAFAVAGVGGIGTFGPQDANRFALVLLLLGGVLVGAAAGQVLSGAHYARGDTRTPAIIAAVAFSVGVALKVAGLVSFELVGLAVATSLYYGMATLVNYYVLRGGARGQGVSPTIDAAARYRHSSVSSSRYRSATTSTRYSPSTTSETVGVDLLRAVTSASESASAVPGTRVVRMPLPTNSSRPPGDLTATTGVPDATDSTTTLPKDS